MTENTTGFGFLPPAKIQVPVLRTTQIARPQIETALQEAMMRKRLLLVSAPAGFGKTTAMTRALAGCGDAARAFWFSIDEDDTIQRFLGGLVAALDPADVPWRVSAQALAETARDGETGPGRAADAVADALSATDLAHGIIVIDDIHRLNDELVIRWLDRLVERLPSNWTLAIATRIDPPLALARLRLRGELAEFRSEDLRFGLEEFEALAAIMAPDATADDLEPVWNRMSGWPAGCELALRAGLSKAALSGVGTTAYEVLSSEVLNDLPQKLSRFLVQCSILPELTVPLCVAVTGDPETRRRLREITQRGLFATAVAGNPPVLRLHDLFREFLQTRLREECSADAVRDLLVRAAGAEENPGRRIGFLIEAGEIETAEEVLAQVAPSLLLEDELDQLLGLIRLFPEKHTDYSAKIAFIAGLCESAFQRWSETQRLMSRAARLFEEAGDMEMRWRAKAYELLSDFGLARTGDAMTLLAHLPPENADVGTRALFAFGEYLLSRIGGTVAAEMRSFDQTLELLTRCHEPIVWNACAMHIYLGMQRGMRARTERYATAVLAVAGERHDTLRDSATSMRIWNRLVSGEYQVAAALIRELDGSQAWNNKPYSVRGSVSIAKSLLVFLSGDAQALRNTAAEFLSIFEGREGLSWAYWRGLTQIFFGKLHAALGDWDAVRLAQSRLDRELSLFNAPYLRLGRIYLEAVCALNRPEPLPADLVAMVDDRSPVGDYLALEPAFVAVRAMIHARDHEYEKAWNALSRLVDEVAGDGEEFHLMLLGSDFLRTLANIPRPERAGERARSTLMELAAKLEADGKAHGLTNWSGLEGLTPRELEILQCLANGDSNKVIARKHSLSPHTVKRHVANILNKLGLASRGQAAAWFRDHAPAAARQG